MKCTFCTDAELTVKHTQTLPDGSVKRRRECISCKTRVTTYERRAEAALSTYERRLVVSFRDMSKEARKSLWATVRALLSMQ